MAQADAGPGAGRPDPWPALRREIASSTRPMGATPSNPARSTRGFGPAWRDFFFLFLPARNGGDAARGPAARNTEEGPWDSLPGGGTPAYAGPESSTHARSAWRSPRGAPRARPGRKSLAPAPIREQCRRAPWRPPVASRNRISAATDRPAARATPGAVKLFGDPLDGAAFQAACPTRAKFEIAAQRPPGSRVSFFGCCCRGTDWRLKCAPKKKPPPLRLMN